MDGVCVCVGGGGGGVQRSHKLQKSHPWFGCCRLHALIMRGKRQKRSEVLEQTTGIISPAGLRTGKEVNYLAELKMDSHIDGYFIPSRSCNKGIFPLVMI